MTRPHTHVTTHSDPELHLLRSLSRTLPRREAGDWEAARRGLYEAVCQGDTATAARWLLALDTAARVVEDAVLRDRALEAIEAVRARMTRELAAQRGGPHADAGEAVRRTDEEARGGHAGDCVCADCIGQRLAAQRARQAPKCEWDGTDWKRVTR